MSNPYLPRIGPSIGGVLPGLPQRAGTIESDPSGPPVQAIVLRATGGSRQTFITPSWATRARVTALGRGGQGRGGANGPTIGSDAPGGGGAGLAATLIEDIPPGTSVDVLFGTATVVNFLNYQLSGGNGGDATSTAGGVGGVGSGGAINFNGGAGTTFGAGGGAAGRGGNGETGGGDVVVSVGGNSGPGDQYSTGGGAGGAQWNDTLNRVGAGGISRVDTCLLGAALIGKSTTIGGGPNNPAAANCNGGDGGGGSGGSKNASISNIPGAALVLIELW